MSVESESRCSWMLLFIMSVESESRCSSSYFNFQSCRCPFCCMNPTHSTGTVEDGRPCARAQQASALIDLTPSSQGSFGSSQRQDRLDSNIAERWRSSGTILSVLLLFVRTRLSMRVFTCSVCVCVCVYVYPCTFLFSVFVCSLCVCVCVRAHARARALCMRACVCFCFPYTCTPYNSTTYTERVWNPSLSSSTDGPHNVSVHGLTDHIMLMSMD